jgi:glycosyltransferase involved in cell wall biosynthesis
VSPRITLAVLAYRQSGFIEAAVRSALAQECEPLEVLLSDDASPDDTFEKMQALAAGYRGPHQVVVRRNRSNLGMGEHFNEVMRNARGALVVLMAGDDLSLPDRAARVATTWDESAQQLDLIASHVIDMDHDGTDRGVLTVDDLAGWRSVEDWARRRPYIVGAAHAVTRRLFERFGPLEPQVAHEDQANVLRALCAGRACTIDAALVRYRRGGMSGGMRDFSGEHFIGWLQRQTSKHVALHEQWRKDAAVCGHAAMVDLATRREYRRELFLHALLAAPGLAGRWRATCEHTDVSLGWRLRKFLYVGAPGLAARVRAMQTASRGLRRR